MQKVFKRSALVIALAALSVPVLAASQAETRALGHIEAFAGYTMHGAGHAYSLRDTVVDADGSSHVRFDRMVQGMKVIGGDMVVHADRNGNFKGASHTLRQVIAVNGSARVNPAEATRAALAAHAGDVQGAAEKVVYARGAAPELAYDVRVFSTRADGTPSEKHVIVSATTGAVLEAWDDIHDVAATGTGKSLFSGSVSLGTNSLSSGYEMRDPSRGGIYTTNMAKKTAGSGTIFTDADNVWGSGTTADVASAAVDAQYGTAVTWDYFKNVHGRIGIDGTGAKVAYNKVHYGRNYANAFWSDSCFCMTYGDGDGTSIRPLVSLDVAGHEMTHGITSRSANLTYSGESGGLNEATSDIFGSMVEFYANNTTDAGDYLIGEKIMMTRAFMRNMMQPSKDGVSADCWYSGLGSIDVHYSSGPANHMFFMLAEGTNSALGASKTCNAGDTKTATGNGSVTGIGRDAAGKIWYRALTVYMTSSTNYAGARVAAMKAAGDLYGAGSTQQNAVAAAFSAINVN